MEKDRSSIDSNNNLYISKSLNRIWDDLISKRVGAVKAEQLNHLLYASYDMGEFKLGDFFAADPDLDKMDTISDELDLIEEAMDTDPQKSTVAKRKWLKLQIVKHQKWLNSEDCLNPELVNQKIEALTDLLDSLSIHSSAN